MPVELMRTEAKAWVERNPLRQWRTAHGVTIDQAARLLAVNFRTIQYWEHGSSLPGLRNMQAIAHLIGEANLTVVWLDWHKEAARG